MLKVSIIEVDVVGEIDAYCSTLVGFSLIELVGAKASLFRYGKP